MLMTWLLILHALSTVFMMGLIWFVQVVHYPLFAMVEGEGSGAYALSHQRRTTWVVGPAMLVELSTAALLVFYLPGWMTVTGLVLVGVAWCSTAFDMVPRHQRLLGGHDAAVVRRLVLGNWVRTFAWSVRGVLSLVLLSGSGVGVVAG